MGAQMYLRITEGMAQLIQRDVKRVMSFKRLRSSAIERFGGTVPDPVTVADEILAAPGQVLVSRETFNKWLLDPKFVALLQSVEIETSTRFELFDVLDADLNGSLELREIIIGLMKLRGSITKCEIVAIRMKVRFMEQLITDIWRKVECEVPGPLGWNSCDLNSCSLFAF